MLRRPSLFRKGMHNSFITGAHRQSVSRYLIVMLVAAMAVMHSHHAYAVDPLDRVSIEDPKLVNLASDVGERINVEQTVQIRSKLTNNQDGPQDFAYIVQIKDSEQRVIALKLFEGSLNAGQVLSPAPSWTPQVGGLYVIEIFVWDSLQNQSPLAESKTIRVTAS